MLEGIRAAQSTWIGKTIMTLVFGLIVLAFVVWGIGDVFRGGGGNQIAQLSYPHLSSAVIFDKVEEFYKRFYFRPSKIWEIVREMLTDWQMMKRRLREGVEFFDFLRRRKEAV